MRPTWLIEAGVYGPEAEPLLAEVRRQGMAADLVPHRALRPGADVAVAGRVLGDGDRVVGYGTFPFARQIQVHRRWRPGAWCNAAALDCAVAFAHLGKFLLGERYILLSGNEAVRQGDWLFAALGRDGVVFARPAACDKRFTGRCLDRDSFAAALGPVRYDPEALVVVAAPVPVGREWRLLVVGDVVVTASQYADAGRKSVAAGCPAEVWGFAETVLAAVRWRPDPIYFLDVAESAGRLGVVEVSGFSTSWLYACDLAAVVAAVGELAERLP